MEHKSNDIASRTVALPLARSGLRSHLSREPKLANLDRSTVPRFVSGIEVLVRIPDRCDECACGVPATTRPQGRFHAGTTARHIQQGSANFEQYADRCSPPWPSHGQPLLSLGRVRNR